MSDSGTTPSVDLCQLLGQTYLFKRNERKAKETSRRVD